MEYLEIKPIDYLQPYVRCFGILKSKGSNVSQTFRIVADGCPGLIFQEVAGSFFNHNGDAFPHLYLHGTATAHSQNTATEAYCNIIVHFWPNALKAIFGMDANELTNGYAALDGVLKNDLSEMLFSEEDMGKKITVLSDFLTKQLIRNRHTSDERVAFFIRKITANGSTLAEVQSHLNISERSLERLVKTNIGFFPKLFVRINRFQSAFQMLEKRFRSSLTDIAYDNDYFDQSHYIREFREFAGAPPKEFLSRANGPLANFPEWK